MTHIVTFNETRIARRTLLTTTWKGKVNFMDERLSVTYQRRVREIRFLVSLPPARYPSLPVIEKYETLLTSRTKIANPIARRTC